MLVRVWNDNVHPYSEKFKGQQVHIAAKGFVEMDLNDAHMFLGTRPAVIEVDANGIQKPTSYKMLRIEKITGQVQKVETKKWVCHACRKDLHTKAAYDAHVSELHLESLVDEEAREEVVAKKRGRPKKKGLVNDSGTDRDGGAA